VADQEWSENCFDVGVVGRVRDKGDDKPVQWVTIEITGNEDDVRGPFTGKTNADGNYNIYIGSLDDVGGVELKARVTGPNAISEDEPEWVVVDNCDSDDANQIMEIDWDMKR
jgi:hypothetical protein